MKNTITIICVMLASIAALYSRTPQEKEKDLEFLALCISIQFPLCPNAIIIETINHVHSLYRVNDLIFTKTETRANYFQFPQRAIVLDTRDTLKVYDMWIAELSHAVQFADDTRGSCLLFLRDVVRSVIRAPFLVFKKEKREKFRQLRDSGCSFWGAVKWISWNWTYDYPGTFESVHKGKIQENLYIFMHRRFTGAALERRRFFCIV